MKISRDWLNNYIVSNKTDDELVDAFTELGLECASKKNNSIDANIVVHQDLFSIAVRNSRRTPMRLFILRTLTDKQKKFLEKRCNLM